MSVISVSHLTRQFTTHIKEPGLTGAIKGLFKRQYQTKTAVDDVSFSIEQGEFVGFLGPNGAGKTTTLKMLSGILHPTSGEIRVLGYAPWKREAAFQKRISLVLGQKNQLWWDLPAYDSFELNKEIYGISDAAFKSKIDELGELLDITRLLHVPVRKLSLGERMKCELVASLLHSPEVLFLDEPTIGLDLISQAKVREFLRDYNQKTGLTVILTSHYIADVEALCKRIIVINGGRAIFDGPLQEMVSEAGNKRAVRLTLSREATDEELETVRKTDTKIEVDGLVLTIPVPSDAVAERVSELLALLPVRDLAVEDVAVESVIRELFTSGAQEDVATAEVTAVH